MDATLNAVCKFLLATPLSKTIQASPWIIPTIQTIHILAIAVIFSSAILVDLRLCRLIERDLPLPAMARRFLRPIWPVLLVALATGCLMIIGEPRRALENTTFYLKMALLLGALSVTTLLQWTIAGDPGFWETTPGRRAGAKFVGGLSILVWCGVIFAGRWIAYTQVGG